MHRLSSAARHSNSSSKIIQFNVINTQRDQAHRRRSLGAKERAASSDGLSPKMHSRNLSVAYGSPSQTVLVPQVLARNLSSFHIHPEKLKQIMKERDGQSLCQYYDSHGYKMKAVDFVEEQNRVINELTPQNNPEGVDVTYEHMLNCAQPRQKPKVFVVQDDKEEVMSKVSAPKKSLIKRLLRIRRASDEQSSSTNEKQVTDEQYPMKTKAKECKKKYRKRTTILPLYLKKIQSSQGVKDKVAEDAGDKGDTKTELMNANVPFQITKSEYKIDDEVKAQRAQRLLKEKVLSVEYENELVSRIKPKSKYAVGTEEERHWYQNPHEVRRQNY